MTRYPVVFPFEWNRWGRHAAVWVGRRYTPDQHREQVAAWMGVP